MPRVLTETARGVKVDPFVICIDSNEPTDWEKHFHLPTVRKELPFGHYSIAGLEHKIAIVRRDVEDFIYSLTFERTQFERTLHLGKALQGFFVFVESNFPAIFAGRYERRKDPRVVWDTIAELMAVHNAPIIPVSDSLTGARLCEHVLARFWAEQAMCVEKALQAAQKATAAGGAA